MTNLTDAYKNPLEADKLYKYSQDFCILNNLNLREDENLKINGRYLEVTFSSGKISKIYEGAFQYFYPVENFSKVIETLEGQIHFLRKKGKLEKISENNKANLSSQNEEERYRAHAKTQIKSFVNKTKNIPTPNEMRVPRNYPKRFKKNNE